MAIKTFNINEEIYKEYSEHCKKSGISMSKKVENFIQDELNKLKSSISGKPSVSKDTKQEPQQQPNNFRNYLG